jgi:hypothetical protein
LKTLLSFSIPLQLLELFDALTGSKNWQFTPESTGSNFEAKCVFFVLPWWILQVNLKQTIVSKPGVDHHRFFVCLLLVRTPENHSSGGHHPKRVNS